MEQIVALGECEPRVARPLNSLRVAQSLDFYAQRLEF